MRGGDNMEDMTIFMLKGERTSLAYERINALARQDLKRLNQIDLEIKKIEDTLKRIELDKVISIASKLEKLNDYQLDQVSKLVDSLINQEAGSSR